MRWWLLTACEAAATESALRPRVNHPVEAVEGGPCPLHAPTAGPWSDLQPIAAAQAWGPSNSRGVCSPYHTYLVDPVSPVQPEPPLFLHDAAQAAHRTAVALSGGGTALDLHSFLDNVHGHPSHGTTQLPAEPSCAGPTAPPPPPPVKAHTHCQFLLAPLAGRKAYT